MESNRCRQARTAPIPRRSSDAIAYGGSSNAMRSRRRSQCSIMAAWTAKICCSVNTGGKSPTDDGSGVAGAGGGGGRHGSGTQGGSGAYRGGASGWMLISGTATIATSGTRSRAPSPRRARMRSSYEASGSSGSPMKSPTESAASPSAPPVTGVKVSSAISGCSRATAGASPIGSTTTGLGASSAVNTKPFRPPLSNCFCLALGSIHGSARTSGA